jgi:tellurite resistance protein TehA-like permease
VSSRCSRWHTPPQTGGAAVVAISRLAATGLWGFGVWWLAVALLVRYLRTGPLPFGLGWWAFTFPLGAFTVATLTLARAWDTAALEVFGAALYIGLVAFWILVTVNTLRGLGNGQVWKR